MVKTEISEVASQKPLRLHPYLFALLPIVSLYSTNTAKLIPRDLIRPSFVSLSCVLLLSLVLWIAVRDPYKRALVASSLVVPFFLQRIVYSLDLKIFLRFPDAFIAIENVLATIAALSFMAFLVFVLFSRRSFRGTTSLLNLISTCALFVACVTSLIAIARQGATDNEIEGFDFAVDTTQSDGENPDIYHILLDAYAGEAALNKFYKHDNSAFLSDLRQRGFHVVDGAFSNYHWTDMSVASMLNLNYHAGSEGPTSEVPTRHLIRDNRVRRFLEKRGYSFISFATGYSPTEIHDADKYLQPNVALTEFDLVLLDHTPLRILALPGLRLAPIEGRLIAQFAWLESLRKWVREENYRLHRDRISFIFSELESIGPADGPLFVFAHIKCPHEPFVFDKDGKPIIPQGPQQWLSQFANLYRGQVVYANRRILEVIDKILKHSPEAIIILHGDHGPRSMAIKSSGKWEDYVQDRTSILLALHTPKHDVATEFSPHVSLVNTYRALFNQYFGAHMEMLEDVTYVAPIKQEFEAIKTEHIRVTDPF